MRGAASPPSLVALVGDTLAGVLTLEDVNEKEEEEAGAAQEQPPGMAAIDAILHECKDAFFAAFEANGGDAAQARQAHGLLGYFAFLGVDASARRRGVGAVLIERGVAELRRAGFTYGVAFCTSRFSAALFARAGFSRWGGVSYQAFAMPDGTHPFETLPKDECAVMVMRLRGAEDAPAAPRCS
jgi:GNAT superfamily N-acetyltransferase